MNRYFIKLAYDGTNYHGWQSQRNARSVQDLLNRACSQILKEEVRLTGAGRTDTGVHAKEFYAHFDLTETLNPESRQKLVFSLNGYLPADIVVYEVLPVVEGANARFSAVSRTYRYVITTVKNPFLKGYAWYLFGDLDVALMNKGAEILGQTSDFTSFSKVDTDTRTNLCRVTEAFWEKSGDELVFTITADRFLRNMVRAIVGTLLEMGRGKLDGKGLKEIIDGKDRSLAGDSVPAYGLFLVSVRYPGEIFLES